MSNFVCSNGIITITSNLGTFKTAYTVQIDDIIHKCLPKFDILWLIVVVNAVISTLALWFYIRLILIKIVIHYKLNDFYYKILFIKIESQRISIPSESLNKSVTEIKCECDSKVTGDCEHMFLVGNQMLHLNKDANGVYCLCHYRIPDLYTIITSSLRKDVELIDKSTISAFSTSSYRGSLTLLILSTSTSLCLLSLNSYYNNLIDYTDYGIEEILILIGYTSLILIGIFPSDDSNTKRNWHHVLCANMSPKLTSVTHKLSAMIYLLIPLSVDIYLNNNSGKYPDNVFYLLEVLSLILTVIFFICQGIIIKLDELTYKRTSEINNDAINYFKANVTTVRIVSYIFELLCFTLTTITYLYIEVNIVLR